jgi:glucose-6-phosphate 1-dehydrogenase
MDLAKWEDFASHLYYQRVELDSVESFKDLASTLKELEGKHNTAANKIFYLAIPPSAYGSVAGMLGKAGLARSISTVMDGAASSWRSLLEGT